MHNTRPDTQRNYVTRARRKDRLV